MTKEDIIKPENLVYKKPTLITIWILTGRKPHTDVHPLLPLRSSACGRTDWYSLTRETVTWHVSVRQKQSMH